MSYTAAVPVAARMDCATCRVSMSGDDIGAVAVGLFRDAHDGHDTTEEGVE